MSEEIRGYCWNCGHALTRLDFGREARCPGCGKDVHCCRNCRLYAPGRPNDCFEPQSERVIEKTRANFCDWFEADPKPRATQQQDAGSDDPRAAAEALFRKD